MILQCTKKLSEELPVVLSNQVLRDAEPLYSWHAHLFLFKRRKCVLVINNETRYNFVLYGLRKDDFKRFDHLVVESISENLLKDGISLKLIDHYLTSHAQVHYAPTSNRSIISQMNEMIRTAHYFMEIDMIENQSLDMDQLNRRLNRFVMLKLRLAYSGETMRVALQNLFNAD